MEDVVKFAVDNQIHIVMTGIAFNHIFGHTKELSNAHKTLLSHIKIFARAKPKDKQAII